MFQVSPVLFYLVFQAPAKARRGRGVGDPAAFQTPSLLVGFAKKSFGPAHRTCSLLGNQSTSYY